MAGTAPGAEHNEAFRDFAGVGRPVRRLAWAGTALALLSLLVLLLPQQHLPTIDLIDERTSMPVALLWVGVAVQTVGSWYLLAAGAFAKPRWLRWSPLALVMLMQFYAGLVTPLGFVLVLLTALFGWATGRGRIPSTAAVLAVAAALALALDLAILLGGLQSLALYYLTEVQLLAFVFLPMVFLTGIDLARVGPSALRAVLRPTISERPAGGLFWVAVALSFAMALGAAAANGVSGSVLMVLCVVAVGALVVPFSGTPSVPISLLIPLSWLVFLCDPGYGQPTFVWSAAAGFALGLVALALPALRRRFGGGAALLILLGLWNIAVVVPIPRLDPSARLSPASFALALALATLGRLILLRVRGQHDVRRVRATIAWLLGFAVLAVVWGLLDTIAKTYAVTALPVLLLLLALAHRILTDGHLLRGADKRPAGTARVLVFFGCLLLLAGWVVLGSGATGELASAELPAAPERYGLLVLGLPLVILEWHQSGGMHGRRTEAPPP